MRNLLTTAFFLLCSHFLLAQNGAAVQGFGIDGKVFTSFHSLSGSTAGNAVIPLQDGNTIISISRAATLARHLPDGKLDASFGVGGYSEPLPATGNLMFSSGAVLHQNGTVLVQGIVIENSTWYPFVARYLATGMVDKTFGQAGINIFRIGNLTSGNELVVLPDNKIMLSGVATISGTEQMYLMRLLPDGKPDLNFGKNGVVTYVNGPEKFELKDMAVQPDGRILVGGTVTDAPFANAPDDPAFPRDPRPKMQLWRFLPDGTPDLDFGEEGKAIFYKSQYSRLGGLTLQTDGKIVVAGSAGVLNETLVVARYLPDGELDQAFGSQGGREFLTAGDSGGRHNIGDVLVLRDEKILIGGQFNQTATIWLLTKNGERDLSFYGTGHLGFDQEESNVSHMALYTNGKIGFTGYMPGMVPQSNAYLFARLQPDVLPDYTLAGTSYVLGQYNYQGTAFHATTVQPDGKILTAGTVQLSDNIYDVDLVVLRYNQDGSLDQSFGIAGKTKVGIRVFDKPAAIALYPDGRIVISGETSNHFSVSDFFVVRLLANGAPDKSFSEDGIQTIDFFGAADYSTAVLIQTDGKIVAAGTASNINNRYGFAATRLLPNGSLDLSFNAIGKQFIQMEGNATAIGVAQTASGKIILAGSGYESGFSNSDFIMARYNSNGIPDGSFGAGGIRRTDFGGNEMATAFTVAPNGQIYLVGPSGSNKVVSDLAIAQYNTDGELYNAFSNDGKHLLDMQTLFAPNGGQGYTINFLEVQQNGKMILGGNIETAAGLVQGFARLTPDAQLDLTFGMGGGVQYDPQNKYFFTSGAIWNDRLYVAGYAGDDYKEYLGLLAAYHIDDQAMQENNRRLTNPTNASSVQVSNNPATTEFTLNLDMKQTGPVQLRVLDASGNVVERRQGIAPLGTQRFGASYRPGTYLAEVTQGTEKVIVKLIKQ